MTQSDDRIGWTNWDDMGVISADYREDHITCFREFSSNQSLTLWTTYQFDTIHLPSVFSVAVKIVNDVTTTADNDIHDENKYDGEHAQWNKCTGQGRTQKHK